MKNFSLALFAALMLLGWTSLATAAIAAFAGQPAFSSRAHSHHETSPVEVIEPAPLYSNASPVAAPTTLAGSLPRSE